MTQLMFQTRARVVQAIQFTGENIAEVVEFLRPFGGPYRPTQATAARPLSVRDSSGFIWDLRPYTHVLVVDDSQLRVLEYGEFMRNFEPLVLSELVPGLELMPAPEPVVVEAPKAKRMKAGTAKPAEGGAV